MNTRIELEKQQVRFLAWLEKHELTALSPIHANEVSIEQLLPLCFDERKDQLSLHASWLLEKYAKAYPDESHRILPIVIQRLPEIQIEGSQRTLSNILIDSFSKKNNYKWSTEEEEHVIEVVFNWLITPQKAVAVVANCFELLSYLSKYHPWVTDELIAQIEFFLKNGSPAIQARGNRVLGSLRKNT